MLTAVNLFKQVVIGHQIKPAFSFFARLQGLLGRKGLSEGEGLLLYPCSSIHCFGMRFAIDAVFLDGDCRVLVVRENMGFGALASCKGARYVLELAAGQVSAKNIGCGDRISFQENDPSNG